VFSTSGQHPEMSQPNVLVPVIDLGPFWDGGEAGKLEIAAEVNRVCRDIGFFAITNHRIPQSIIDEASTAAKTFFDLPAEDKCEVVMTKDYPYGYSGFGQEILSNSKQPGKATPFDLKETFQVCIGPEGEGDGKTPPKWPSKPAELKPSLTNYYRELEKLAANILRIFALALKLPEDWFEPKINRHQSALRILNYPHPDHQPLPGQLRASEHTDYGSLTILLQDNAPGGLQVRNRDGSWQDIKYVPGSFVINIGDLMARWTNDAWVSTLHRVINPPPNAEGSTRRQSMAFFHNINEDAVVSCIETCTDPLSPNKYPPVKAGDYLLMKHHAANKY